MKKLISCLMIILLCLSLLGCSILNKKPVEQAKPVDEYAGIVTRLLKQRYSDDFTKDGEITVNDVPARVLKVHSSKHPEFWTYAAAEKVTHDDGSVAYKFTEYYRQSYFLYNAKKWYKDTLNKDIDYSFEELNTVENLKEFAFMQKDTFAIKGISRANAYEKILPVATLLKKFNADMIFRAVNDYKPGFRIVYDLEKKKPEFTMDMIAAKGMGEDGTAQLYADKYKKIIEGTR